MSEEIIDLIVHLSTDGTLMAYNKDMSINILYSDLHSWKSLHNIYKMETMKSTERKGKPLEVSLKYIKYYFKNAHTNELTSIPNSHIKTLLNSIVKK